MRILKPIEEEQKRIKDLLLDLAEYYSVKLSDRQLEMYTEDLVEMGSEQVQQSIAQYRRDWNSQRFPLPSILRKQVYFGVAC